MQVLVSEVVSAHSAAPRADATATSMVPTVTTACWYCVECRRRAAACPGTSPAAVRGEVSEVSDSSELASSRHSSLVMDRQPDACNTNSDSRHSTHIRHSLALDSSVTRRSSAHHDHSHLSGVSRQSTRQQGAIEATKFGCAIDDVHAGAAARNLACRRRPPRQRCHGDVLGSAPGSAKRPVGGSGQAQRLATTVNNTCDGT